MNRTALPILAALASSCSVEYVVPLERETDTVGEAAASSSGASGAQDTETGDGPQTCAPPRLECDGSCIDPQTDRQHCGDCGEYCDSGETCVAGYCADGCGETCDDEREVCVGSGCECRLGFTRCGGACVDLDTNPAFCGECMQSCLDDDSAVCEAGDCQDDGGCSAGLTQCGRSCVDLRTHPLHCSECGEACDGDEVCIEGDCEDL